MRKRGSGAHSRGSPSHGRTGSLSAQHSYTCTGHDSGNREQTSRRLRPSRTQSHETWQQGNRETSKNEPGKQSETSTAELNAIESGDTLQKQGMVFPGPTILLETRWDPPATSPRPANGGRTDSSARGPPHTRRTTVGDHMHATKHTERTQSSSRLSAIHAAGYTIGARDITLRTAPLLHSNNSHQEEVLPLLEQALPLLDPSPTLDRQVTPAPTTARRATRHITSRTTNQRCTKRRCHTRHARTPRTTTPPRADLGPTSRNQTVTSAWPHPWRTLKKIQQG